MAHELLIKYGMNLNSTWIVTGVTNDSGLTDNPYYFQQYMQLKDM